MSTIRRARAMNRAMKRTRRILLLRRRVTGLVGTGGTGAVSSGQSTPWLWLYSNI